MSQPAGRRSLSHLQLRASEPARSRNDSVVVEEPLEIRLGERPVAVTLRTPGNDIELAIGFLFSENVIADPAVIDTAAHCDENQNIVEVRTEPGAAGVNPPAPRNFYATSSCGVCGKASIDDVRVRTPSVRADPLRVPASLLASLPEQLARAQQLFRHTGSLHAAALFDASGRTVCLREDIGRHNAVDKLLGWAALEQRLPLRGHVLLLSGRCGFELVQKALAAEIPLVAAISGPSSLAIELAEESGQTLVAFLRPPQMNVYTHADRVQPD
jgi:FdhD protein